MGEIVEFPSNGHDAGGYLAVPVSGSGPGLVVIQEWWGLVPHIERRVRPLRRRGLRGPGARPLPRRQHDHRARRGRQAHDGAQHRPGRQGHGRRRRLPARPATPSPPPTSGSPASAWVAAWPWCSPARRPDAVSACVPFYGVIPWPDVEPDWSKLDAAVLGHFAENDGCFTPDHGRRARGPSCERPGKEAEFIIHPGADHAFFNDTRPEVHDADRVGRGLGLGRAVPQGQHHLSPAMADAAAGSDDRRPLPRARAAARPPRRRVRRRLLRPAGAWRARVEAEPVAPAGAAGGRRRRPDRRPRRRGRRRRARRLAPALAAGPGRRPAHQRPQAGRRADRLRRRGRVVLRRAPHASATRRRSPPPTAASTRRCPAAGALRERVHRLARGPGHPGREARAGAALAGRRLPRAHRSASSACPRASTSTGSSATTSRGRASTTTRATCAAGWRSTPTCRCCRTTLAHLVAHEAYPGHHTEHTRKEVGLVRQRGWQRGDDLPRRHPAVPAGRGPGRPRPSRSSLGERPEAVVAEHLRPARHPLRRRGRGRGARRRRVARRGAGQRRLAACTTTAARSTTSSPTSSGGRSCPGPGPRSRCSSSPIRDLAGLHLLLRRGPAAVPGLRRRRPDPLRHACSPSSWCRPTWRPPRASDPLTRFALAVTQG